MYKDSYLRLASIRVNGTVGATKARDNLIRQVLLRPTVFKDEAPLSLEYIPAKLPHREDKLTFLAHLFRSLLEKPGSTSPRALITGPVGTGKTVIAQKFGLDIVKTSKEKRIGLHYVHVNCRECKGSLFAVLRKVMNEFEGQFPKRGFSSEELLQAIMHIMDKRGLFLILALDELEALLEADKSALYTLTRVQEDRVTSPARLSLICMLRDPRYLESLDRSTVSTLQQNFIELRPYASSELLTILKDRISLAFKEGSVQDDTVEIAADVASSSGDARYAIELLWRAGKYADSEESKEVKPENVRKAAGAVYPTLRNEYLTSLSLTEKLFLLALSRFLEETNMAYASMGDLENAYKIVCEEYNSPPRAHTQLWKYMRLLSATGLISTKLSGKGTAGRTTLIGLTSTPASTMKKCIESALEALSENAKREKLRA
jgi:cell division control protein 6